MQRQTACVVVCAILLFLPRSAAAQSMLRDLAVAFKDTAVGKSAIGQALRQQQVTMPVPKMGAARDELMHALDSLRDGTNFTIITFGERAAEWPGGVRVAGPATRGLARAYVATLSASGPTPMAEALQLGFASSNVRTLFVVTDGRPTTAPVLELVKQLQESRESRRMVINTVGIGRDQDGGLLCQLALDNEGVYVRDGAVACTFSPCAVDDGVVTFYPPGSNRKRPTARVVCSSAERPDCTPGSSRRPLRRSLHHPRSRTNRSRCRRRSLLLPAFGCFLAYRRPY